MATLYAIWHRYCRSVFDPYCSKFRAYLRCILAEAGTAPAAVLEGELLPPPPVRLAVFILAFGWLQNLRRLLRRIHDARDRIVVHIDKKKDRDEVPLGGSITDVPDISI